MKNMVLLIDTNVLLDYILFRQPQYKNSFRVISACMKDGVKGYVAFHSLSSMWYMLRKKPESERRRVLSELTNFLTVVAAPHEEVVNAIRDENFPDFEDCLQEKCALAVNADFIVTNNVKDFKSSKIPAVTPAEIIENFCRTETR